MGIQRSTSPAPKLVELEYKSSHTRLASQHIELLLRNTFYVSLTSNLMNCLMCHTLGLTPLWVPTVSSIATGRNDTMRTSLANLNAYLPSEVHNPLIRRDQHSNCACRQPMREIDVLARYGRARQ